jgi:predicted amino acid-binding ACT domain protein
MRSNKEVILLNISGPDKPGITTSLSHILAKYNVGILDIGQAVIHDELALGILFEVPEDSESSPILKDLLFRSYELGMNAKFAPISLGHYEEWVKLQGKERYMVTLIARMISAQHIARVSDIIYEQNLNIDIINRLSGRPSLLTGDPKAIACVHPATKTGCVLNSLRLHAKPELILPSRRIIYTVATAGWFASTWIPRSSRQR